MDMNAYEDLFSARLIAPDTWAINTSNEETPAGCECYLLEGDEMAIAIDSGMSRLNIAAYMQTLTDRPLYGVINTHGHCDHIFGNGYFNRVFQHRLVDEDKTSVDPDASAFPVQPQPTFVDEGFILNLGNRELEIMEIGAHALSSIAILDKGQRILFTGDELETGWLAIGSVLHRGGKASIRQHYENMQKLKARYDEFDIICCAHHGSPVAKETLNHFLICDRMILDGVEGDPDVPLKALSGYFDVTPDLRVMRYKSAHICYSIETIEK